jgi:hypothetical protein
MAISVLATKCRFCGEPVGRPRDESRKLTIDDLGGVSSTTYAPSDDVLEAMEAFRLEELAGQAYIEEPRRRWFGFGYRKRGEKKARGAEGRLDELADLDARRRELAGPLPSPSSRRPVPVSRERIWTRKVAIAAGAVAAIILLYFGGLAVKAQIDDYFLRKNRKPVQVVQNPAIALLNQPGRGLDALKAALDTLAIADTPDNRKVANDARAKVKEEVANLLNAEPWKVEALHQASMLMTRALEIDPANQMINDLRREVDAENAAYKMTIADIKDGQVILRVYHADPNREPDLLLCQRDKVVEGRFRITYIGKDYITFEDLKRKSGPLTRSLTLSRAGAITSK